MSIVYMRDSSGSVFQTGNPEYHKDAENLGGGQKGYAARQEYIKSVLREMIKPGDTVYTNVNSVSSSGMSRNISCYIVKSGKIRNIDHLVSDACGVSEGKHGGLQISGCGMDMCFHAVYSLGRALFPDGFGTEGKNPAGKTYRAKNRKAAQAAVKRGYVFRGRNGDSSGWDTDGGYSLRKDNL